MELAWPWLPPVLLGGAVLLSLVLLLFFVFVDRIRPSARSTLVANTGIISGGRRFRGAARAYRALLVLSVLVALVALGVGAITASRVVESTTVTPETRNRDIVLCLDVSGSMRSFDAQLLTAFENLAGSFKGERIGLVLFDSSPLQVFPLTDDYLHIRDQLQQVADGLSGKPDGYAYRDGTRGGGGSSRVGDGVAGCVLQFDLVGLERSRTIVVATDNQTVGEPILTLSEAGRVAVAAGIQIFALNPDERQNRSDSLSLRTEVEATGGLYFPATTTVQSVEAIRTIVAGVTSNPATAIVESPIRTTTDDPARAIWLLTALTTLLFLLVWRLRL